MSNSEKKPIKTVGHFLTSQFHCDDPVAHAENMIDAWLCVLTQLSPDQCSNHFGAMDIRLISEHLLDFKAAATSGHAYLSNVSLE
jgi:hypothetical protein